MIRALLCLTLSGCVQLAPTLDRQQDIGCCVLYAEPARNTVLILTVTKPAQSLEIKAGARWKF